MEQNTGHSHRVDIDSSKPFNPSKAAPQYLHCHLNDPRSRQRSKTSRVNRRCRGMYVLLRIGLALSYQRNSFFATSKALNTTPTPTSNDIAAFSLLLPRSVTVAARILFDGAASERPSSGVKAQGAAFEDKTELSGEGCWCTAIDLEFGFDWCQCQQPVSHLILAGVVEAAVVNGVVGDLEIESGRHWCFRLALRDDCRKGPGSDHSSSQILADRSCQSVLLLWFQRHDVWNLNTVRQRDVEEYCLELVRIVTS